MCDIFGLWPVEQSEQTVSLGTRTSPQRHRRFLYHWFSLHQKPQTKTNRYLNYWLEMFSSLCFFLSPSLPFSSGAWPNALARLVDAIEHTRQSIATTSSGWNLILDISAMTFLCTQRRRSAPDNQVTSESSEVWTYADRVDIKMLMWHEKHVLLLIAGCYLAALSPAASVFS